MYTVNFQLRRHVVGKTGHRLAPLRPATPAVGPTSRQAARRAAGGQSILRTRMGTFLLLYMYTATLRTWCTAKLIIRRELKFGYVVEKGR